MGTVEILWRIFAGVLLTGVNAFFVATEFALTRVRQLPESEFQEHERLRLAWKMTERLEIYLTGCQLGITGSTILLGVVAEPAVSHLLRPLLAPFDLAERTIAVTSVVLSVGVIQLIHKIWGEQAPTYLGVERPKAVAKLTAPLHFWWCRITYPVIWLGDGLAKLTLRMFGIRMRRSWVEAERGDDGEAASSPDRPVTRGELRRAMGQVLSGAELPEERQEEVLAALEIDDIPVRDIMVPRDKIVAIDDDAEPARQFETLAGTAHTRLPLIGKTLEDFRGIVYVPAIFAYLHDLEAGRRALRELAAPPLSVAADRPVSQLIDLFQEHKQELSLVTEDDRVVGLVTTTDAFEAIAGDLQDPFD